MKELISGGENEKIFSFALNNASGSKSKFLGKKFVAAAFFSIALNACGPTDKAEQRALEILSQMTLEEKVGQVIQGDISTVTLQDAKNYNLGSVLNGGNSAPGGSKTASWRT